MHVYPDSPLKHTERGGVRSGVVKGGRTGRELRKRSRGRRGGKKDGGREEGGVYIINYDFITCFQFLGDLLFWGALMNNKKRGQRERKRSGVIDEASGDTATSWRTPVLLHKPQHQGDILLTV